MKSKPGDLSAKKKQGMRMWKGKYRQQRLEVSKCNWVLLSEEARIPLAALGMKNRTLEQRRGADANKLKKQYRSSCPSVS